jgi:DUF4097 and DUF4098 domain-containing protein YvlB
MQYGVPFPGFIFMTTLMFALSAQSVSAQEDASEESRQTFQLSANPRVEILNVSGRVRIETSDSNLAEVEIIRVARQQKHLKYHLVSVDYTPASLRIEGKEDRPAYERGIQVEQQVRVKIPRRVDLIIKGVGDSVSVGDIEGPLKAERVSGSLEIGEIAGPLEVAGAAGDLRATVTRLDQRGIRIANVSGEVELRFTNELNAELEAKRIGGGVYVSLPNINTSHPESAVSMNARIGNGGAPISILKVGGLVRLAHRS